MKTSKEIQLKILDKMRENIESGKCAFDSIQYKDEDDGLGFVDEDVFTLQFNEYEYRIKPQTITINGVEIPKPLNIEDIRDLDKETNYYIVCCASTFYDTVCIRYMNIHKPMFAYLTKEEAIEASKALFGIRG